MKRYWLVAQREYLENLRTRGFWLSLLVVPLVILIGLAIPALLAQTKPLLRYAVIDDSGWLGDAIAQGVLEEDLRSVLAQDAPTLPAPLAAIAGRAPAETLASELSGRLPPGHLNPNEREAAIEWWRSLTPQDLENLAPQASAARFRLLRTTLTAAQLNLLIERGELFAYFVIPGDPIANGDGAVYVSRNLTNLDLRNWFTERASRIVQARRMREQNLSESTARWIQTPLKFDAVKIDASGAASEAGINDALRQWAPVAFVYILWISIFTVTQMLLTNTIEEKSNKLIEVLLSSISAVELMGGKILGIGATGLTIIAVWLGTFIVATGILPGLLDAPSTLDLAGLARDPIFLLSFVVYFLLGYFFYAALLAGIGSVCNNLKEAQNLMIPVQLFLFIPLILMIPIGRDPGGSLARALSWFPPFTPFVMMNRAAMPPGALTYVLTTLLMLGSIWLALRAGARMFRTGILMTGRPPRMRELLRLLRQEQVVVGAASDGYEHEGDDAPQREAR